MGGKDYRNVDTIKYLFFLFKKLIYRACTCKDIQELNLRIYIKLNHIYIYKEFIQIVRINCTFSTYKEFTHSEILIVFALNLKWRYIFTNFIALSIPNLLRNLFHISPNVEKNLSIEPEEAGAECKQKKK